MRLSKFKHRFKADWRVRHGIAGRITVHWGNVSCRGAVPSDGCSRLCQERGDHVPRQQAKIFGDDGDEELEDKALGTGAVFLAFDEVAEDFCEYVRSLAGNFDAVVAQKGLGGGRQQKVEREAVVREVAKGNSVNGIEKLCVEVVNPEFLEVAEDDVGRSFWDDVSPVVEDLIVMFFEVLAARFHLDEHPLGPKQVSKFFAALRLFRLILDKLQLRRAWLFGDAKFVRRPGFDNAVMAQGTEEVVEKALRLAFFISLELSRKRNEFFEGFLKLRRCHEGRLANGGETRKTKEFNSRYSMKSPNGVERKRRSTVMTLRQE